MLSATVFGICFLKSRSNASESREKYDYVKSAVEYNIREDKDRSSSKKITYAYGHIRPMNSDINTRMKIIDNDIFITNINEKYPIYMLPQKMCYWIDINDFSEKIYQNIMKDRQKFMNMLYWSKKDRENIQKYINILIVGDFVNRRFINNNKIIIRSNITHKELVQEYEDDMNYWNKLSYVYIALGMFSSYLEYKYIWNLYIKS